MVTGKRAFHEKDRRRRRSPRSSGRSRSRLADRGPSTPAPCAGSSSDCLAKEPEERYASTPRSRARPEGDPGPSVRNLDLRVGSARGPAGATRARAAGVARARVRRHPGRRWRGGRAWDGVFQPAPLQSPEDHVPARRASGSLASPRTERPVVYGASWDGAAHGDLLDETGEVRVEMLGLEGPANVLAVSKAGELAISLGSAPPGGLGRQGHARSRAARRRRGPRDPGKCPRTPTGHPTARISP